ncbi:hypothetical protein BJ508DRAFT_329131 [Ascobolus immersus RN42]|uniref:Uncharacterized protein n=1 Tax=Ascobolus immersus RN42 TaxID=1160509 RepID=A0A3N4HXF5_ASCIM|nr:hypothetical protein BJ508DRAFT_329131 [Ascobolus immersus RN42]
MKHKRKVGLRHTSLDLPKRIKLTTLPSPLATALPRNPHSPQLDPNDSAELAAIKSQLTAIGTQTRCIQAELNASTNVEDGVKLHTTLRQLERARCEWEWRAVWLRNRQIDGTVRVGARMDGRVHSMRVVTEEANIEKNENEISLLRYELYRATSRLQNMELENMEWKQRLLERNEFEDLPKATHSVLLARLQEKSKQLSTATRSLRIAEHRLAEIEKAIPDLDETITASKEMQAREDMLYRLLVKEMKWSGRMASKVQILEEKARLLEAYIKKKRTQKQDNGNELQQAEKPRDTSATQRIKPKQVPKNETSTGGAKEKAKKKPYTMKANDLQVTNKEKSVGIAKPKKSSENREPTPAETTKKKKPTEGRKAPSRPKELIVKLKVPKASLAGKNAKDKATRNDATTQTDHSFSTKAISQFQPVPAPPPQVMPISQATGKFEVRTTPIGFALQLESVRKFLFAPITRQDVPQDAIRMRENLYLSTLHRLAIAFTATIQKPDYLQPRASPPQDGTVAQCQRRLDNLITYTLTNLGLSSETERVTSFRPSVTFPHELRVLIGSFITSWRDFTAYRHMDSANLAIFSGGTDAPLHRLTLRRCNEVELAPISFITGLTHNAESLVIYFAKCAMHQGCLFQSLLDKAGLKLDTDGNSKVPMPSFATLNLPSLLRFRDLDIHGYHPTYNVDKFQLLQKRNFHSLLRRLLTDESLFANTPPHHPHNQHLDNTTEQLCLHWSKALILPHQLNWFLNTTFLLPFHFHPFLHGAASTLIEACENKLAQIHSKWGGKKMKFPPLPTPTVTAPGCAYHGYGDSIRYANGLRRCNVGKLREEEPFMGLECLVREGCGWLRNCLTLGAMGEREGWGA